jgi:hypothetical protein
VTGGNGHPTAPAGGLLCDFCAMETPTCFYPVVEFAIVGGGATWMSGERFYACPPCRGLVDADDWAGMAARCAIPSPIAALIWQAFRDHRAGPAVDGAHPDDLGGE